MSSEDTITKNNSILRILTCGSVDDGKSTLIGRLLYDTNLICDDQLIELQRSSAQYGTTGKDLDLALLVDGLEAEREQGITIDVAYRFFSTDRRKFIIADTPGHEQYTRNMVTGASSADLAILMVDARKGLVKQTKRHAHIVSLLGIKHVVLAVNKMDLVDFLEDIFLNIEKDFSDFSSHLQFKTINVIPVSARFGDNTTQKSQKMSWYKGQYLLRYLEEVDVHMQDKDQAFRMPVQWINRPNSDFRGISGSLSSGSISKNDEIFILPSKKKVRVKDIVVANKDLTATESINEANAGDAVTIVLDTEVDISRGDLLCDSNNQANVADQFSAKVIWMSENQMYPGRPYLVKINANTVMANITAIKHRIDTDTFKKLSAKSLKLNEIAICNISTNEPIIFDPYDENRDTGSFIIIDRMTNETVGAGIIQFPLHRANNIKHQALQIDKKARSLIKNHKSVVLWFTGLSGSGKSTISDLVEQRLYVLGKHTYILDGDNVRHGLNRDLGFTNADRVENIRRIGEVSKLMADAGLITLVSFISPFRSERQQARSIMAEGDYIEVFIDTPIEVCQERDVKGLYKKALSGEIENFTGISSPYEPPRNPELHLRTVEHSAEELADMVITYMKSKGILDEN